MRLLLACGPSFTKGQVAIIYCILAAVFAVPCLAIANVFLTLAGRGKRSPIHFVLLAIYALVAIVIFVPEATISPWTKLGTVVVAANLVIGQFVYLVFVTRRERRASVPSPGGEV